MQNESPIHVLHSRPLLVRATGTADLAELLPNRFVRLAPDFRRFAMPMMTAVVTRPMIVMTAWVVMMHGRAGGARAGHQRQSGEPGGDVKRSNDLHDDVLERCPPTILRAASLAHLPRS